jgi:hypothetical protein
MRIDKWTIAATVASLLPCVGAEAATEANFALGFDWRSGRTLQCDA